MKVVIRQEEFDFCYVCCLSSQPVIVAKDKNGSEIRICVPCFQKLCRGVKKHALNILVQTGINVRKDV